MQFSAKPMNKKRFWSCLLSNGGRKLVQMRAEPSLLGLCRMQPSFCKLLQMACHLTFAYSKWGLAIFASDNGINDWQLIYKLFFFLYSNGERPVCCLKYLRKVNCSGKRSSCATSFTRIFLRRSNFFAWLIVTNIIHSEGVCPETFLMIRVKWLGEIRKASA